MNICHAVETHAIALIHSETIHMHSATSRSLLTLGAHAKRGLRDLVCVCVHGSCGTTGYGADYERY